MALLSLSCMAELPCDTFRLRGTDARRPSGPEVAVADPFRPPEYTIANQFGESQALLRPRAAPFRNASDLLFRGETLLEDVTAKGRPVENITSRVPSAARPRVGPLLPLGYSSSCYFLS